MLKSASALEDYNFSEYLLLLIKNLSLKRLCGVAQIVQNRTQSYHRQLMATVFAIISYQFS